MKMKKIIKFTLCFVSVFVSIRLSDCKSVRGKGAIEEVVTTMLTMIPTSDLHLHIEDGQDTEVVEYVAEKGFIFKLFDEIDVWSTLSEHPYFFHIRAQHVLVGSFPWIINHMETIKSMIVSGTLNIHYTHFIYVIVAKENMNSTSSGTSRPDDRDGTINVALDDGIQQKLKILNDQVMDDLQAVAVDVDEIKNIIKVFCRVDKVNGSEFTFCGNFNSKGAKKYIHPLWPSHIDNFHGRVFQLTAVKKPTVFYYTSPEEGLEKATGWASEVTRWLFEAMNASAVLSPSTSFGSLQSDGSWTGMVGALHRGEADLAPLDFSTSFVRWRYIKFSTILSMDYGVILSRAPSSIIKPFLLLQIFTPMMWGLLGLVVLVTGIVTGLLMTTEKFQMGEKEQSNMGYILEGIVLIGRQYLFQSSKWLPKRSSSRLLCAFSFAVSLMTISIYRSSVTAFFAIPFKSKPIDSSEDLFASDVVPAVRKNTVFHNSAVNSKEGFFLELSKRMVLFTGEELSTWTVLKKMSDGEIAFVDLLTSALGRARQFEKQGEDCKFYMAKQPVRLDHDAFAMKRDSPLIPPVDKMIRHLRSFGIIQELKRRYYSSPCNRGTKANEISSLGLTQMQSAFYILIVGFSVALISFMLERILKKCKREV